MKTIFLSFLLILASTFGQAEGVASWTKVTGKNVKNLDHHGLAALSQKYGKETQFTLIVRSSETQLLPEFFTFSITVYDKDGKQILLSFSPKCDSAVQPRKGKKLPTGVRAYFKVANHLIDQTKIRYSLPAKNNYQSHFFSIEAGKLSEVAKAK